VTRPRLLYVVTEDWAFLSHRLPMARAARDAGFEVHVATRVSKETDAAAIRSEGFVLHHVPFARGRLSPVSALRAVAAIRAIHRAIRPSISHHVGLQATVLASLASLDSGAVSLNALTGLGFAFTSSSPKAVVLKPVLSRLLRLLLNRRNSQALVQNADDRAALLELGIDASRIGLIEGSGVSLSAFAPMPEPPGPVTVGFVGRLLRDKGITTLVAAHRKLVERGCEVRLAIAGFPDPANPSSITDEQLDEWKRDPSIIVHGRIIDVARFWSQVHIAVLPSRREGLPKSLMEAAACGRPLIAADVPGCRSVVIPDRTGLLVPVDDSDALADAIEALVASAPLRARLGAGARELTEQRFGEELIATQICDLYGKLYPGGDGTSRAA